VAPLVVRLSQIDHRSAWAIRPGGSLRVSAAPRQQHSLPEVPGLDLSAAYVPASEGLEVSGDFYEVFPVQGGWAIFFYSDGVTDARSPDMQYFEDRLADELAGAAGRTAAQTTRMVQDLVARFSQDDLRDDMTILVARVTTPAGA
jgi:serine phosphatase RsbU (regulator of sigma subunit)